MKKSYLLPLLFCYSVLISVANNVTPAGQLPTYYQSLDGKSGKNLFDAIHAVAKVGYSDLGYRGLWTAYGVTDLVPGTNQIWDMYSNCTFTYQSKQCGNYSKECDCYNREHSIPKSWFGGAESKAGSDLFHIVPTDGKVNGMRGNQPFGEVSSASYNYDDSKLGTPKAITITGGATVAGANGTNVSCGTSPVFEPMDEYKGDFARGYMGAMIKWAGDYNAFTQEDGSTMFSGVYTSAGHFGLTPYGVALLMKWHREDPVSQKEIDRNNAIQQTQGNRNPFIDYPYLAEYIWGCHAGEPISMSLLISSGDAAFIPGESDGRNVNDPTAYIIIQQTTDDEQPGCKFIKNGRVLIDIDGQLYDVLGQKVQ